MPAALLADRSLGARAKVIYGLLQTLPGFRRQHGTFTYADLGSHTNINLNTLRRAIGNLDDAGWVRLTRQNSRSPIRFWLGTPDQRRKEAEVSLARRRIDLAENKGEAIMHEYLSLLIDSTDFAKNTKPSFLVNPETQELLELDRYYESLKVAFEFNGDQHERAGGRFTQKQVNQQRRRDLIKAGLCTYAGVHLIIVRAEDLDLNRLIGKIHRFAPLRKLEGHEFLIEVLDDYSCRYYGKTQEARRAGE
jgi:hypothetical protein